MVTEILDQLRQDSHLSSHKKAELLLLGVENAEILKKLTIHSARKSQTNFVPGDLVTQTIMFVDPSDGEPMRAYSFPLPGQPAQVVEMLPSDLQKLNMREGSPAWGVDDMVISTMGPTGVIQESVVSSRHFKGWTPGESVDPAMVAFITGTTRTENAEDSKNTKEQKD